MTRRRRAVSGVIVVVAYAAAVAVLGGFYLLLFGSQPDAASRAASPTQVARVGAGTSPGANRSTTTPASGSAAASIFSTDAGVGALPDAAHTRAALDALKPRLVSYLAGQAGTYGFYLTTHRGNGQGGTWLSVGDRAADSFKMASTFKLPLVLYLYTLAHQGTLRLSERLVYDAKFYSGGAGSLRYEDPGGSYTMRDLADRAIRESDNVAHAMLTARLGRQRVLDFMADLGGAPVYHDGNSWDTPQDLVLYMRKAADFVAEDAELGGLLMHDLTHAWTTDRIRAGTPAGVVVAHKTGNLDGVVDDVGLVQAPAGDYYLAVMSSGVPDDETGAAVEQRVAEMVYEAIGE